ncbi:MAG: hypothetical protein CVV27_06275 [Candidatus Melainabacteria bacterium HGW-Melainabacteria-1]|nr:MAG: hypothetical protein CVV27_06275 [Candidatus Melainabacteria bacterium HGW-Melainabacteria-1]
MSTQVTQKPPQAKTPSLWPAENTYLDAAGEARLLDYASSIPTRLAAIEELAAQEASIASETSDLIFERYPKVEKRIEGREKTERDLILILRYCGEAMLRDDRAWLEEQLLHWLRTMLVAYRFGQGCLRDSYLWLDARCKQHLSAESYRLLAPYLNDVIQVVPEGENQDET